MLTHKIIRKGIIHPNTKIALSWLINRLSDSTCGNEVCEFYVTKSKVQVKLVGSNRTKRTLPRTLGLGDYRLGDGGLFRRRVSSPDLILNFTVYHTRIVFDALRQVRIL